MSENFMEISKLFHQEGGGYHIHIKNNQRTSQMHQSQASTIESVLKKKKQKVWDLQSRIWEKHLSLCYEGTGLGMGVFKVQLFM